MYSNMGKVRKNNEDNYFIEGKYREDIYSTEDDYIEGSFTNDDNKFLAVFDGMGGEACGEIASLVAAKTSSEFSIPENDEYLSILQETMNKAVLEETKKKSLVLMGTTSALIQFSPEKIYISNVGDSRIYKFNNNKLVRISVDHIANDYNGKAPLTKFLGFPDEEAPLDPFVAMGNYIDNDLFLLTTDGLTDMLSNTEIEEVLTEEKSLEEYAKILISKVLDKGAIDNTTFILCKILRV